MKLISFTVPCYNSQDYLRRCVDSLLVAGEDIEIIIVNDGSTDSTLSIAKDYESRYPGIVKVIDKPNGGHGSGVNAGLKAAQGLYFKVVDSDDRLDESALKALMEAIRAHVESGTLPDLYVTNFVYDHAADGTEHVSKYDDKIREGKICGWEKIKKFRFSRMMLMHALLYKREVLLKSGLCLPEHTFYVDNIYAYQPLPHAQNLYYLNVNLYRYFIGRDDQSVNRVNFVKRYDQQIRVMQCMIDAYKWEQIKKLPRGLKRYMRHSLEAIMMTTLLFVCAKYSKERKAALKEMWRHIKQNDKKMYSMLRHRSYAVSVNWLPWKLRGALLVFGYNVLCKKVKLG